MYLAKVTVDVDRFPNRRYYPFNVPIFREPQELLFRRPVALFVGENGSGKSTLLDAIARRCEVQIWDKPRRHQAHNNPFEMDLKDYVAVAWADGPVPGSLFRAETFREFADFLDDVALCDPGRLQFHGGQILNLLSHGQGFLSYFRSRFQARGLYFLDEPEAALSPASQIRFLEVLQQLEAAGRSQFLIATHSPLLLACPGAQIFSFDGSRIREVPYEETSHFRIYHQFFASRSAALVQPEGAGAPIRARPSRSIRLASS